MYVYILREYIYIHKCIIWHKNIIYEYIHPCICLCVCVGVCMGMCVKIYQPYKWQREKKNKQKEEDTNFKESPRFHEKGSGHWSSREPPEVARHPPPTPHQAVSLHGVLFVICVCR